jgi:hypothetical protein
MLVFRLPRVLWAVGPVVILLALPSLFVDLYCDDQRLVLKIDGRSLAVSRLVEQYW